MGFKLLGAATSVTPAQVLPALVGQDIVARGLTLTGQIGGSGPAINLTGVDVSGTNFMMQWGSNSGMYLSSSGGLLNFEMNGSNAITLEAGVVLVPSIQSNTDMSTHGITIHDTGIGASGGLHLDPSSEGTAFINFLRPNGNSNDTMLLGGGRIVDGSAFTNNIQNSTSGGNSMLQVVTSMTPASGSATFAALELNPIINGTSTGKATSLAIASVTNTYTGGTVNLIDAGTSTSTYESGFTSKFKVDATGNVLAAGHLGVGNAASASVIPAVGLVKKIEIFDASGTSLGFIPVYSAIT